jgi:hypothetical protein
MTTLAVSQHFHLPDQQHHCPSTAIEEFRLEDVVCHEALGGLLKHHERRAA